LPILEPIITASASFLGSKINIKSFVIIPLLYRSTKNNKFSLALFSFKYKSFIASLINSDILQMLWNADFPSKVQLNF
jgi:hypothetical protein